MIIPNCIALKNCLHFNLSFYKYLCFDNQAEKEKIMNRAMQKAAANAKQLGQGMTEYIVIVALIAVAAIAVTQLFGSTVRNQMAGISQEIAGKNGTAAKNAAGTAADNAVTQAAKERTLSTYTNQAADGKSGSGS